MQRLFSTFPASWPGLGLLVLRLALAGAFLADTSESLGPVGLPADTLAAAAAALLAACVAGGIFTPFASLLIVVFAFGLRDGHARSLLLTAGAGVSLAMLGPGAWSVDAWLYGRKRIRFDDD